MSDHGGYEVGRGKPPMATRFPPGKSGNPKGRPKNKLKPSNLPHEFVLGRTVSVIENGIKKKMPADTAFLRAIMQKGMADGARIRNQLHHAIERSRTSRPPATPDKLIVVYADDGFGHVDPVLRDLGMATMLDRFEPTARLLLEAWVVEEALDRLGDKRLAIAEQQVVVEATHQPHKVRWPDWWSYMGPEMA